MRRLLSGARDFLVLAAGILVVLSPLAGWCAHAGVFGWTAALAAAALGAAALALLGLFLTWGDEGRRVRNAARSIAVLVGLAAGVIALLAWAASTAGGGS